MTKNEYKIIQIFLSQSCGIVLGEGRQYLVENRLARLMTHFDFSSFSELIRLIQMNTPPALKLKSAVVDAMTTNETFWFRDDLQFQALKKNVLPELFEKKTGVVKVWSAACSSGQEPYTISLCASGIQAKNVSSNNIQIIATDISETILQEAKSAVYSEFSLSRGIDTSIKNQYFHKIHKGYKLNKEIVNKVRFQPFNLLKPFSVLGRFDVIFCRNVLIYFTDEVKQDILCRMAESLEPGGYLFLSSTESMPSSVKGLELVRGKDARYFKKVS